MATNSWITILDTVDNLVAGYKDFITQFSAAVEGIAFVREPSVGDLIVDDIVSLPGGYQKFAGHHIYYLNDSLHSVAPIYMRLRYGPGGTPPAPAIYFTFGTGHDGSGGITGTFVAETMSHLTVGPKSTNMLKSYSCVLDGTSWLIFAEGLAQNGNAASAYTQGHPLCVFRTKDEFGDPTPEGCVIYILRGGIGAFNASVKNFENGWFSPPATDNSDTVGNNGSYAPRALGSKVSATADLKKQAVPHVIPHPDFRIMSEICSLLPDDGIASGTEFSLALTGVTERNFIAVHGARSRTAEAIALVWE